jgi:hypothetical protein
VHSVIILTESDSYKSKLGFNSYAWIQAERRCDDRFINELDRLRIFWVSEKLYDFALFDIAPSGNLKIY